MNRAEERSYPVTDRSGNRGIWVIVIAITLYVIVVGGLSIHRYRAYSAGMYNLGTHELHLLSSEEDGGKAASRHLLDVTIVPEDFA